MEARAEKGSRGVPWVIVCLPGCMCCRVSQFLHRVGERNLTEKMALEQEK